VHMHKEKFMIYTSHEIYSADEIKRDEGAGCVEIVGEGRDCTFIVVEGMGEGRDCTFIVVEGMGEGRDCTFIVVET